MTEMGNELRRVFKMRRRLVMGTKIWRKIRRAFTFAVAIALAGEVINCSAMVAQAADAQFYIRYDGEPTDAAHASPKDYTAGMAGTISDDVVLYKRSILVFTPSIYPFLFVTFLEEDTN